jgi:glycosyltransferase involved in cell wall biosynthesis
MSDKLSILQVSTRDFSGGAERVAYSLMKTYRDMGFRSRLAVGFRRNADPDVVLLPNDRGRNPLARLFAPAPGTMRIPDGKSPATRLAHFMYYASQPGRAFNVWRGYEDFDYPGTRQLPGLAGVHTDIVHCHNLHGAYFDLRQLPRISREIPLVITMHDAWLLSGHCAHSFICERWKTGCGHCPDLTIYPAIRRDATARNFRVKEDIYRRSRLYLAAPCNWILDRARQSMLAPGIVESRIIPNGINLDIYHPSDRAEARKHLGLPEDAKILLFIANGIRNNIWKDYETLRKTVAIVADACRDRKVLFLALGEDAPPEQIGNAKVVFVPYQKDPAAIARYYQSADVYVHAARADTFPNTVLEAMACGTPVVATAIGGIPEQVDDGKTGFLTAPGDAGGMAGRISELLTSDDLNRTIGGNAAEKAAREYDLRRTANSYLRWYRAILEKSR